MMEALLYFTFGTLLGILVGVILTTIIPEVYEDLTTEEEDEHAHY